MKTVVNRPEMSTEQTHEDFNMASTLVVIFLFLIFMGTSVYLMVTNY